MNIDKSELFTMRDVLQRVVMDECPEDAGLNSDGYKCERGSKCGECWLIALNREIVEGE